MLQFKCPKSAAAAATHRHKYARSTDDVADTSAFPGTAANACAYVLQPVRVRDADKRCIPNWAVECRNCAAQFVAGAVRDICGRSVVVVVVVGGTEVCDSGERWWSHTCTRTCGVKNASLQSVIGVLLACHMHMCRRRRDASRYDRVASLCIRMNPMGILQRITSVARAPLSDPHGWPFFVVGL